MKQVHAFVGYALIMSSLLACDTDVPAPVAPADNRADYSLHPKHSFYQGELEKYRQQHEAPGAIMLVKTPTHGLWIGATGKSNLEHQTPMRGDERIRVGSITKTLVATLVLKLTEQGKLKLDDKLSQWLPQTAGTIPQAGQITIRHLLTHTSGVLNTGSDNIPFQLALINRPQDADMTQPEKILQRFIYEKPLYGEPGNVYRYSNTGYLLLGMIIEKASGKSLKDSMQEGILAPAGMTDSYLEKRNDPRVARSYFDLYGDGRLLDVSDWERAYDDGGAPGGLITTVSDVLKFSDALFGGKLLSAASLEEMKSSVRLPSCPNGDCEYGFGMETWNLPLATGYGHNGGVIGIDANWLYFPARQATVVLFMNKGIPANKGIIERVLQ
ncbi:hypothetical protein GCM10023189_39860 [Nibrella saemangeumensis]|uniref:Beta-lactamase-related domain-containing protein n=1 Tax=Nibrella saemangeumensis TaxID=1084526 RepID=A0ABP8NAS4_9BACT